MMGWCSGTSIFDAVCEEVLELSIPKATKERILSKLIDAMHDHDWDCEGDSEYYDDPQVRHLLRDMTNIENAIVCFTGFRDEELAAQIEVAYGTVASSLTKDVTHLVVGGKSLKDGSSKVDKAKERGLWVGTVQEFLDEFDLDYGI